MSNYIINVLVWTLALYGLIEIIKDIIYTFVYNNLKSDGIYLIIAVKNKEDKIEGFLRSIMYRASNGKEKNIKDIIVTDLGSNDKTLQIINNLKKDYGNIKVSNWNECKETIDNISNI